MTFIKLFECLSSDNYLINYWPIDDDLVGNAGISQGSSTFFD
jgi:hypothetical protein